MVTRDVLPLHLTFEPHVQTLAIASEPLELIGTREKEAWSISRSRGGREPGPYTDVNVRKNPDERDLRYIKFVSSRLEGRLDEETAAEFGLGSTAALYRQLKGDGYPVCPECGAAPVPGEHCVPPRKRRPAKGGGGTVMLPPASRAAELFESALERFRADVTRLARRSEYLRGERFVVRREGVTGFETPRGKTPVMYRYLKEGTDAQSWRIFCEERGVDPEAEFFDELTEAVIAPAGAASVPPEPLTRLVGIYVLSGGPIEPLIEALHPAPEHADWERVNQAVEEQRKKTGQLAALVRGSKIRRGPLTEDLDPLRHAMAVYVHRRRAEGVSYERIIQELDEGALYPKPNRITRSEVERLADMKLQ